MAGFDGLPGDERWEAGFQKLNPDDVVYALAFDPSDQALYAGGRFTRISGVEANHVARWDGTTWSPLGSGIEGEVYTLAAGEDGTLYAGGNFTAAGGAPAVDIARWDGNTWSTLGSGMDTGAWTAVYALAVDGDGILYAGGTFTSAGGVAANRIARWDGANWSTPGSG